MKLVVYSMLSTRSQRAMVRKVKRFGRPAPYNPRGPLVERLSKELGLSKEEVLSQIQKEREFLIKDL